MHRFLILIAFLIAQPVAIWAEGLGGNVVIAYRVDTPPFSKITPNGEFEGLLVDFCNEAISRAGFNIVKRIPVTAATRFDLNPDEHVDLICDPTTVTQNRAARFDFSPIVFIANSSFLSRRTTVFLDDVDINKSKECSRLHTENRQRKLVGVGMVGDTTANGTYDLARSRGLLGETLEYALCSIPYKTHDQGIDALCEGRITHYFGDVDILRAHILERDDCSASLRTGFFAYEPYALVIPSEDPAFKRKFISAVYSLFSDGTAVEYYTERFHQPMSGPLEMLFRINNIPAGAQ